METNQCSLCSASLSAVEGPGDDDGPSVLPDYLQLFLLHSVLRLSYIEVARVMEGGSKGVRLCSGCESLVHEAFVLEEKGRVIQDQLNRIIEKVEGRMKMKEGAGVGRILLGLGRGSLGLGSEVMGEEESGEPNSQRTGEILRDQAVSLTSGSAAFLEAKGGRSQAEETPEETPEGSELELDFEEHVVKLEPADDTQGSFLFETSESIFPYYPVEQEMEQRPVTLTLPFPFRTHKPPQPEAEARPSVPTKTKRSSSPATNTNLYHCGYKTCRKFFTRESHLKSHELIRHGAEILAVNSNGQGGQGTGTGHPLQFRCGSKGCSLLFPDKTTLSLHEKTCELKPYPCKWEGCNRRFRTRKLMHGHISATHRNARKDAFPCDVPGCQAAFREAKRLAIHRARCVFKHDSMREIEGLGP